MTDRISSFTVTLDHDMRVDDVEFVINAIKAIKHVRSVVPKVANIEQYLAQERARHDLGQRILKVIWPDTDKKE